MFFDIYNFKLRISDNSLIFAELKIIEINHKNNRYANQM